MKKSHEAKKKLAKKMSSKKIDPEKGFAKYEPYKPSKD